MRKHLALISLMLLLSAPAFSAEAESEVVLLSCSAVRDSHNAYGFKTPQMTIRIAKEGIIISGGSHWDGRYRASRSKSTSTQMFIVAERNPRIFGSVNRLTGRFQINQVRANEQASQATSLVNSVGGVCRLMR